MNKIEKTVAEFTQKIEDAEKEWEARKMELDAQVNREYGYFVGRVEAMKKTVEMLSAPDEDESPTETEKKEKEIMQDQNEEGQESIGAD